MRQSDSRRVVERWYESFHAKDFAGFAATMHDDVIYNLIGRTPVSGRWLGKRQLFDTVMPLVMGNLEPATVQMAQRFRIMAVDGPIVVGLMQGGATNKQGERYEQVYCLIFRVEQDVIVECWEFFDTVQAEARLFKKPIDCGTAPKIPFSF